MNKTEYLLACIGEECGEVQKVVGKSLRFGLDNCFSKEPNYEMLDSEIHDVIAAYSMLMECRVAESGRPRWELSPEKIKKKIEKINKYMKESELTGSLVI